MSIHLARWLRSLEGSGWDLHLFPVNHLPEIEGLRGVTVHRPMSRVALPFLNKIIGRNSGEPRHREKANGDLSGCITRPILPLPFPAELEPYVGRLFRTRLGESGTAVPLLYGPHVLARLIRRLRPDLIHSMEFQHAGYRVLEAKELLGEVFPAWLATNWGSDIYYYRRLMGIFNK